MLKISDKQRYMILSILGLLILLCLGISIGRWIYISNLNKEGTDFEFSILRLENNEENMIYSPLSIKYALNMLKDGAKGNTLEQINEVLGDSTLQTYENIENVLSLANSMFVNEDIYSYISPTYIQLLTTKYSAEVLSDPFESADNLNKWVSNKTFEMVPNLLSNDQVNESTKLVLINALAINMEWESPFEKAHEGTFYSKDNEATLVDTMTKETSSSSISYYKDSSITVLAMDYKEYEDNRLQFLAIMPQNDLQSYANSFSLGTLNTITNKLTKASKTENGLDISIPKFSFERKYSLKTDLMALGMTDAFDDKLADFSNIKYDLFVNEVIHESKIDCFEEGTKAAAATAITMYEASSAEQSKPIDVKINHPFLFLILDKKTNEVWFVGTVYEPYS